MLIETVKAKFLELRKARDAGASVLSLVVAAAEKLEKEGKTVTDADIVTAVRKLLEGVTDSIKHATGDTLAKLTREKEILDAILPAQMDDAQLEAVITNFVQTSGFEGLAAGPLTGKVMGHLRAEYMGQFDPGRVPAIVKGLAA